MIGRQHLFSYEFYSPFIAINLENNKTYFLGDINLKSRSICVGKNLELYLFGGIASSDGLGLCKIDILKIASQTSKELYFSLINLSASFWTCSMVGSSILL